MAEMQAQLVVRSTLRKSGMAGSRSGWGQFFGVLQERPEAQFHHPSDNPVAGEMGKQGGVRVALDTFHRAALTNSKIHVTRIGRKTGSPRQ